MPRSFTSTGRVFPSSRILVPAVFNLRQHSLVRGTLLVLGSLVMAFAIAGYPDDRATLKLVFPLLIGLIGSLETFRCLRHRWSLYHGAVVILLYVDVMAVSMILFLFLYPYGRWIM